MKKLLLALSLIFSLAFISYQAQATTKAPAIQKVYRIFNPKNGEHMYTESFWEAYVDSSQHGWQYEGISWLAPKSGVAVHRFYNKGLGLHMYTSNSYEMSVIVRQGWADEGIAFYSAKAAKNTIPIYRLYNPNGNHLYTSSSYEKSVVSREGWRYEGVAYYAYTAGAEANQSMGLSVSSNASSITINATDKAGTSAKDSYHPKITKSDGRVDGDVHLQVSGLPAMASNVLLPTWSAYNGQDDLVWYKGSSVTFNIEKNLHPGNQGSYITNGYATIFGKQVGFGNMSYNASFAPNISSGNPTIEAVIAQGMSLVGRSPYNYGGGRTAGDIARNSFDCSSFVSEMFARAGHPIDNQSSTSTWSLQTKGYAISTAQLRRGDLIIYNFPDGTAHIVIYLGDGYALHDSEASPTGGVGVNRMTDIINAPTWYNMSFNQMIGYGHTYIRRII